LPLDARILIVASDPSFRQSLRFVLEAEGCDVHAVERLLSADAPPASYDCLVVDRSDSWKHGLPPELSALGRPLILLVDYRQGMAEEGDICLVEKPILGRTLIDAVHGALGQRDLLKPAP
jgi:FixJ family two-component response regulator